MAAVPRQRGCSRWKAATAAPGAKARLLPGQKEWIAGNAGCKDAPCLHQITPSGGPTARTAIGKAGVSRPAEPFGLPPGLPTADPSGAPLQLVASQTLCGAVSPDSPPLGYAPAGGPFSAPKIIEPLYACVRTVRVAGAHPGSLVQVIGRGPRSGLHQVVTPEISVPVWPPLIAGEVLVVRQLGCNASGDSGKAKGESLPTPLPAVSVVAPVRPSDPTVTVTGCVPGARVHLFVDDVERTALDTDDSTAPIPVSPPALVEKQGIHAIQTLCDAIGVRGSDPTIVAKGAMLVSVSPAQIVRGTTTKVTVSVTDADTHRPVPGASVFLLGTKVSRSGVPFSYSPALGAANPSGRVTEPVAHTDSEFILTLSDPPPAVLHPRVGPTELVLNTLRITGVTWVVTPEWAPGASKTVTGDAASVTLPQPPAEPNNVVSVTLTVTCDLAGTIGDVTFPPQQLNATVSPNPTKLGWAGKDLTAGWRATSGSVFDPVTGQAVIFVQVQFDGVN